MGYIYRKNKLRNDFIPQRRERYIRHTGVSSTGGRKKNVEISKIYLSAEEEGCERKLDRTMNKRVSRWSEMGEMTKKKIAREELWRCG